MGCGPELHDLFYLTDMLIRDNRGRRDRLHVNTDARPDRARESTEALVGQLYEMVGRGELSDEAYEALKALSTRGQLRPADLAVHRARAGRRVRRQAATEEANALRQVRARLAQLDDARESSSAVLADLESRLDRLASQIAAKEQTARDRVAADEAAARRALTEKVALADSYRRLNDQAQALRDDLARLDEMWLQLEDRAVELEAVLARGEIATLGAAAQDKEMIR